MSDLIRLRTIFENQLRLQELDKGDSEPQLPSKPTIDTVRPLDKDSYELLGKTKKATAAGEFDRVIAKLAGKDSEKFTKIAQDYHDLDKWEKLISESRDNLNQKVRDLSEPLFSASDKWLTRVVETKSLTITLAKKIETKVTKEKIEYEKVLEELQNHLTPELKKVAEDLVKKFTIAEKVSNVESANLPKLGVKPHVTVADMPDMPADRLKKESIYENRFSNILQKFTTVVKSTWNKVSSWAESYDSKLDSLKQKVNNI